MLISLISIASAQTLGDAAKKEKERRAKISGKSGRVITDRELATGSTSIGAGAAVASTETGTPAPAPGSAQPSAADDSKTKEHWQKRVQQKQEEITKLEQQLNSPDLNWGGGVRTDVNPLGQKNLEQRQLLEKQLSQKRTELESIREEARRAGIPAGWVR